MTTHRTLSSTHSDENVENVEYSDALSKNLLDYSMSVIVDRAVPDSRDGLKPVQRRILYTMYKEHNFHDKPYKKTAKISGLVSGNYHPHGTAGVDGAIVTMAQTFKKNPVLIDGQGNFGSCEGDEAAASRYTEVRLSEFAENCYFSNIEKNTVRFKPNYDSTLQEPEILPSIVPMILLTGAEGIAVGFRTNIPTFNISEVIDANCYVLTHKRNSVECVMEHIPGPDFASGGIVCNKSSLKSLYETGVCKVRIRGKVEYVKGCKGEKDKLVVTEVPYTMIGSSIISFMQDVVDLIESGDLSGVSDVIDQTSETPRICLELTKNADVDSILNTLYSRTKLEDVMSCNLLVVHNGRPTVMGVVDLLVSFSEHQKEMYRRKFRCELESFEARKCTLQAYMTAIKNVQEVIDIVKSSATTSEAKYRLCSTFEFSDSQASDVLALRIQRLVSLETDKVSNELKTVMDNIDDLTDILNDDSKLVNCIVKDLKSIDKKFGCARRTELQDIEEVHDAVHVKKDEPRYVIMDRFGYVHSVDTSTYSRNKSTIESEFKFAVESSTLSRVYFFDNKGNVHRIKVVDIPYGNLRTKGTMLDVMSNGKFDGKTTSIVAAMSDSNLLNLRVLTKDGLCKTLESSEFKSNRTTSSYTNLLDSDEVIYLGTEDANIQIVTTDNCCCCIATSYFPVKSRSYKGKQAIKFRSTSATIRKCFEVDNKVKPSQLGAAAVKKTAKQIQEILALHM